MGSCVYYETKRGRYENPTELKKHVFYDADEMMEHLLTNKRYQHNDHIMLAHNMKFDLANLQENSKYNGIVVPTERNGRWLWANIHKEGYKRVRFFDTYNHLPYKLQDIGDLLKIPKFEKPIFLGEKPKDKEEKKILEEYNINDSYLTLRAGMYLQELYNSINANFKCTISSVVLDYYRKHHLKNSILQPNLATTLEHFNAMRGGRTECLIRGLVKKRIRIYDYNSLYPACMKFHEFPDMNTLKDSSNASFEKKLARIMRFEGISEVTMQAPNVWLPMIGLKHEIGKIDKLIFPTGKFKVWLTNFEIREAVERQEYKVLDIGKCYVTTETIDLFGTFVDEVYGRRWHNQDNPFLSTFWKNFLNHGFGKFGQRMIDQNKIIHQSQLTDKEIKYYFKYKLGTFTIDPRNNYWYINTGKMRFTNYMIPMIASYVTAYGRFALWKNAPKNLYYMDTDSYFTTDEMDTGSYLGELKLEYEADNSIFVKPKFYKVGERIRIKGCGRLTLEEFGDLMDTGTWFGQRLAGYRESLKRGLRMSQRLDVSKKLNFEDDKRLWQEKFDPDIMQVSKPLKIDNTT